MTNQVARLVSCMFSNLFILFASCNELKRDKKAKKQFRIRLGSAIHNTIKSLILTNNASRSTSKLRFRSNLTCCWLTLLSCELAYATGACVTQISYDPRSYERNFYIVDGKLRHSWFKVNEQEGFSLLHPSLLLNLLLKIWQRKICS